MKIGLHLSDFTWAGGPQRLGADLARVARAAEDCGFDLISVMDHFFQIGFIGPPDREMLECSTTLGYVAACTSRVNLMTLVAAAPYRAPGILAKTVTTLDVLSGGRAWLGIGAGWYEQEARGLGIPFPPVKDRFEILEEALQVCLQMWKGDQSAFLGKRFRLERPVNSPQALTRPHPPILIGGAGEKKTLRLVARYGDACNLFPTPELPRKLQVLRAHCEAEGRDYGAILKTCTFRLDAGGGEAKIDEAVEQIGQLARLGIQMVIATVPGAHLISPLETIGRRVIPAIAGL